jgi:hypothetical protein
VAQPPKTPPHSDIDGVRRDEKRNTDAANESGQDTGNLKLARDEARAKPPHSDEESLDDRSS